MERSERAGTEPMNVDDWTVPSVSTGSITLVSGRDFAICDAGGDMIPGAVHGLIHHDRRHLHRWTMRVDDHEVRPLASTTPTPFHAVLVARLHDLAGRPLPLLIIRRRWIGHGMREVLELHNSGSAALHLNVRIDVGADFGHLLDVKSGRPSHTSGTVSPTERGIAIECRDSGHRTSISLRPPATVRDGDGWAWHVEVAPHARLAARITVDVADDLALTDGWATDDDLTHEIDDRSHERHAAWQQRIASVVSPDPRLAVAVRTSLEDLASLRIFDAEHLDRVVVAAGAPWYMTLFGRDSLLTAYMALPFAPELARGVLHELADLQGRAVDPRSGEQPGKILHELRSHGGSGPFRTRSRYYGTVDATPLFVLVAAEAFRWGAVTTDDRWLTPAIDAAIAWIRDFGDSDGDGFVDYAPHDDLGLTNQGWKDSWDGVTHADGSLPRAPIALVEVQGYTYAALTGAASLYDALGRDADADRCRRDADALRSRFDDAYWDDRGYYVEALDGSGRHVDSLGSNPGHALWTGIATAEHADRYLDAVLSTELWSGWGVRTLATSMGAYDPLSYHNGSVWPHDTAILIAGAARYGRYDVVDRLTDGLLDAAMYFGGRLPELFSGISRHRVPVPVHYPGSCSPQAWAAGSILLALRVNLGLDADVTRSRLTLDPRGRLVQNVRCDRLVVGDRELSIDVRDGEATVDVSGMNVTLRRADRPKPAGSW
ncbi:MAG TPA: glycogen debranching N-terminal domain-containing protein [Ilumatobacteraceae bacterium]|nr:glycogen debranching N-terminal domain-containing protein [Ilumatobacteraceae bacterium]